MGRVMNLGPGRASQTARAFTEMALGTVSDSLQIASAYTAVATSARAPAHSVNRITTGTGVLPLRHAAKKRSFLDVA